MRVGEVFQKSRYRAPILFIFYVIFVLFLTQLIVAAAKDVHTQGSTHTLILSTTEYGDADYTSHTQKLIHRIYEQPFNLVATGIFFLAITHTLLSFKLDNISKWMVKRTAARTGGTGETFFSEILRFLGEVEVVFGVWVIPLLIAMTHYFDWYTAIRYMNSRNYTEPMFVVVIMILAATKPIIKLSEDTVRLIAKLGGNSVKAWWLTTLTFGPLLGSFITEPGAMTISAVLLAKQFYRLKPSTKLAYATLGLLFVNISVGGVFTNFAAPPVLMVSRRWGWDSFFMFTNFGWKAVIGLIIANLTYLYYFRSEFKNLEKEHARPAEKRKDTIEKRDVIPFWISLVHITFLAWTVVHSHYPVMFVGSFLMFLGFYRATRPYQFDLNMKTPVLVGFFLAGLVIHGSLQAWWIAPVLEKTSGGLLMMMGIILTAFNDNAGITFLATLIPSFTAGMKYAIVSGAVTGGGLTVIANAPNPAGQAILSPFFANGISPWRLFLGALCPTIIMALAFYLLRPGGY